MQWQFLQLLCNEFNSAKLTLSKLVAGRITGQVGSKVVISRMEHPLKEGLCLPLCDLCVFSALSIYVRHGDESLISKRVGYVFSLPSTKQFFYIVVFCFSIT